MLNEMAELKELKSVAHRDFYNVRKVVLMLSTSFRPIWSKLTCSSSKRRWTRTYTLPPA